MFDNFSFESLAPSEVDSNINKQATKVLKSIAEAYSTGLLDDPKTGFTFCQLLACICEGKVEGVYDEDKMKVHWSLTPSYESDLLKKAQELEEQLAASGKIVQGPWQT
tara:strand:+ start:61129 stop:61452 length:324 start_codon:yes stop_codon:yes gene_type:complete